MVLIEFFSKLLVKQACFTVM